MVLCPPCVDGTRSRRPWRRWRRGALAILTAGLVWRLLWPGWPVADGDLRLPPPAALPDAENVFPGLLAAAEVLHVSDQDYFLLEDALENPAPALPPRVAQLLAANAEALQRFTAALARPAFQVPRVPDSLTALPYLDDWQVLGRLAAGAARQQFTRGDQAAALTQWVELIRFGHRIQSAGGPATHLLLGLQLQRLATDEILRALPALDLPPATVSAAVARLTACLDTQAGWRRTCRAEYALWCGNLDAITACEYDGSYGGSKGLLSFYPRPGLHIQRYTTRRHYAAFWRAMNAAGTPPTALYLPAPRPPPTPHPWWGLWLRLVDPNQCGRQLSLTLAGNLQLLPRRATRGAMEVRLCLTALARYGYARQHGAPPESLAQLAPAWLPTTPPAEAEWPVGYEPGTRLLFPRTPGRRATGALPVDTRFRFETFWRQGPGAALALPH